LNVSGTISIFKNGGNGNPRNLVVELVNDGIYNVSISNETRISLLS
jgi:hypothetical protein